jgi:hypothetical protein
MNRKPQPARPADPAPDLSPGETLVMQPPAIVVALGQLAGALAAAIKFPNQPLPQSFIKRIDHANAAVQAAAKSGDGFGAAVVGEFLQGEPPLDAEEVLGKLDDLHARVSGLERGQAEERTDLEAKVADLEARLGGMETGTLREMRARNDTALAAARAAAAEDDKRRA